MSEERLGDRLGPPIQAMAEVVLDAWRAQSRAAADPSTPERVRVAIERIVERLEDLGFTTRDPTGEGYAQDMMARVVEQTGTGPPFRIAECLAPAVFYSGRLYRPAEVTIEGEREHAATDS